MNIFTQAKHYLQYFFLGRHVEGKAYYHKTLGKVKYLGPLLSGKALIELLEGRIGTAVITNKNQLTYD